MPNIKKVLGYLKQDRLIEVSEKMGKLLSKKQKKNIVEVLAKEINAQAIHKVLQVIKLKNLKKLCNLEELKDEMETARARSPTRERSKSPSTRKTTSKSRSKSPGSKSDEDKKKYPPKSNMQKILSNAIANAESYKKFFHKFSHKTLIAVCSDIDDLSEYTEKQLNDISDNEYVDAIDQNIKTFGLQYFLSMLTVDDLETICKEMDLKVDNTGSKERLIDAIIEKKNYTKPKTRNIKPSKEKPAIQDGITKVDLQHWYNKADLVEWLKGKHCKIAGKKSELISRIDIYFNGKKDEKEKIMASSKKGRKRKKSDVSGEHIKKKKKGDKASAEEASDRKEESE